MFETIALDAGDTILSLMQQYAADKHPDKVDLGVGMYRDDQGITPVMQAVAAAEQQLAQQALSKAYTDSGGDPHFCHHAASLALGAEHPLLMTDQICASQTLGGTGALRVGGDFIARHLPQAAIWLPTPTWPNHPAMAKSAGIAVKHYAYVNADMALDTAALYASLRSIPKGDVVLLHVCCHNPTGFDPTPDEWQQILAIVQERELLPFLDMAYQGFDQSLEQDNYAVRLFTQALPEVMIAQSCSKNFGLYNERAGSLLITTQSARDREAVQSQLNAVIRPNYSNPPMHGARVVSTILDTPELRQMWHDELVHMRQRIHAMRQALMQALTEHGLGPRFTHISQQHGMFSYTGLSLEQVRRLRRDYSIYIIDSGRANLAGLNPSNLAYVADAIAAVVKADE